MSFRRAAEPAVREKSSVAAAANCGSVCSVCVSWPGTIVSVERVVRSIADSDADFLVADSREWTKKRLPPVLAAF